MRKLHHHVYVIQLDRAVLENKKFMAANADTEISHDMPLYVGMTGLTPEQRFENHKRGYKGSRYVKRFGIKLLPELFDHLNPMTHDQAKAMEVQLADELRSSCYPVWQH